MKTLFLCIFFACILIGLINRAIAQTLSERDRPKLRYADWIYDARIATPLVYPAGEPGNPSNTLNPPVIPLNDERPLLLEFDDLRGDGAEFRARILHCNADWTPSVLSAVEYLSDYNDFPLYTYQAAAQTKVPYIHYSFEVPRVKLPGNYILLVYRGRNVADVMLTRRFMVYANQLSIGAKVSFSTNVQLRNTHQQVDFDIGYGNFQVLNPREDLAVVIRQNYRWDNALTGLKPFTVNEFDRKLDFRFFNGENSIPGGNEFRFFDIRSTQSRGFGVNAIERRAGQNLALLNSDTPQQGLAYIQTSDFDGLFVVDNTETHRGATEADYWQVTFTLKMAEIPERAVYVVGAFNFYIRTDANRLIYNPVLGVYQVTIPFKQGVWNYAYTVGNPASQQADTRPIEGSYSVTQNTYEILVYARPLGSRADQLVGYRVVK